MEFIETQKPCGTCREEIRDGAAKCIHCGAYQDWRRYFPMSSTLVAMLIALVSVGALAADKLKPLYPEPSESPEKPLSHISFKLLDDQYFARFLALNEGERSGAVIGATLFLGEVDVPGNGIVMLLRNVDKHPSYIIQPGGMNYFEFEFADWENDQAKIRLAKQNGVLATLVVEYANYEDVKNSKRRIQEPERFEVTTSLERLVAN